MSGDLKEGMDSSKGDPKVLFVLNAVLSTVFAYTVLYLTSLAGITAFSWGRVIGFAAVLFVLAFYVSSG